MSVNAITANRRLNGREVNAEVGGMLVGRMSLWLRLAESSRSRCELLYGYDNAAGGGGFTSPLRRG